MAEVPTPSPATMGMLRGQLERTSATSITPPKNIIQTVAAARALYMRYRTQNLGRINLWASIEGLIMGNPPYDPTELDQLGLSHIANFNNGDASAMYEQGGLAFWNLLNQAETLIKIIFHNEQDPELIKFAEMMARHWSNVVREWESFEMQVCTLTAQILKFGFSPVVWSDERDWRWETVETSRFFIPDQASTNPELLTTVFLESPFTVQQLYDIYQEFKDKPKADSPWNAEALSHFLIQRANTYAKFEPPIITTMDLQQRVQNGDLSFDTIYSDEVRLVHCLQKEYDGGISHYIFDKTITAGNVSSGYSDGFLFFVDRQYKSLKEALIIFTASPGVFTVHANRGLGHKIFAPCQATMQLDCDIVNMSRLASTPVVRSPAMGARDFEAIQFKPGVPTNIGSAEFVQNQLGSNIEQLVFAGNYLLNKLNVNIAHSGDDPGTFDRNQGSLAPSQARSKDFKEFGVLKNNVAHFYKTFDLVVQNMVIKMLASKEAYPGFEFVEEWKTRCIDNGVPEQYFATRKDGKPRHFRVKATRVAGDGSTLALIMGLETLAPFASGFSAKGNREFMKLLVLATMGSDYVAPFLGNEEPDESSGGASLAQVENAVMQLGKSPQFSPDNEQRAHIATHFELGRYLIQLRQQQQMSSREADQVFTTLVPHLGEHIEFISRNPLQRQFFESIRKPWDQLSEYARLNRKNAESELQAEIKKQQELEAKNNQVLSEEQLKNLQIQSDIRRKDQSQASKDVRADKANEVRGELMRDKVEKDADNQRLKVQLEANVKKGEADTQSLDDLRGELSRMNGETIAPADIEGIPHV